MKAIIETAKGTINIDLFDEKVPYTVANFANLAQHGYYNGLKFHRVIGDFMIQGGCPDGTGSGGPGYTIDDEIVAGLKHDRAGILSMAKTSEPNTRGSQFFITHGPTPHLDGIHTVFGCVNGPADQEIVNAITQDDAMKSMTIKGDTAALFERTIDKVDQWNAILR